MKNNIIIIGAPRSGTNLLRDLLVSYDNIATWPCDEINFIWRYRNASFPTDELPPSLITPKIASYVQDQFRKIRERYGCSYVVEKTCASSLRVPYINKIFPEAKFIFIVRDGLDVISSISERWHSPIDFFYTLRKARYVPLIDWPTYVKRFGQARMDQLFSPERRLGLWGPVVNGMREMSMTMPIEQVAAYQWRECIGNATESLGELEENRVCRITYENLVSDPQAVLKEVLAFVDYPQDAKLSAEALDGVSTESIGKGRRQLSKENLQSVLPVISEALEQHGYQLP